MSGPSSPTSSSTNNNGAVTQEGFDALKRKYDQLVHKSRKNRQRPNGPAAEERARGIRKVASLYTNVSSLVTVALAQEEGGDESDTDVVAPEEEQRRRKIEYVAVIQSIG